jgi:serine/threonine protein kinase
VEDRESVVDELIAKLLEAEETGDAQGVSTLLADHPEFHEPLMAFLKDHKRLGSLLPLLVDSSTRAIDQFASSPIAAETLPRRFGEYQLLEHVGQGGMGVVYRAEQAHPRRMVAIKMLRDHYRPGSGEMRRFLDEARIIATLDHPHIVNIHEVGTCDTQPYYSMKWYTAGHLGLHLSEITPHPRRAAELVEVIAGAVHHVHQRGILHRDLKPSNILLDADGKPHVSDFGLAKTLEQNHLELTATGQLVGSPAYMAPEHWPFHQHPGRGNLRQR